jgi:hypothetical protein
MENKFVVILTLPSGTRKVVGGFSGKVLLIPIEDCGKIEDSPVMVFDSPEKANGFLKDLGDRVPLEDREKWAQIKADVYKAEPVSSET